MLYGPIKSHFKHRYSVPKLRHASQRHIVISPQLGQGKCTADSKGVIGLPHELQIFLFTDIKLTNLRFINY